MKPLISLFSLVIPVFALAQYSLDRYHPQPIVKSLQLKGVKICQVTETDSVLYDEWTYDKMGNEASHIEHKYETVTEYTYNNKGQLVREYWSPTEYDFSKTDTFIYEKGLLKTLKTKNEKGEETAEYHHEYLNGKLSSKWHESSRGKYKTNYYYSQQGWLDSTYSFRNGELYAIEIWERDTEGKMTAFAGLDGNRNAKVMHEYTYNKDGLETRQEILDVKSLKPIQLYLTVYDSRKLIKHVDRYTRIKDGDLNQADYERRVYVYE